MQQVLERRERVPTQTREGSSPLDRRIDGPTGRAAVQIGRGRRIALLAVHHVRVDGQTLTGGAEKYIQLAIDALLRVGARVHVGYSGDSIYDDLLVAYGPDRLTVERTGWLDDKLSGDARVSLHTILRRRRWFRAVHADTVFAVQQAAGGAFVNSLIAAKSLGLRVATSIRQMPEPLPPRTGNRRWLGLIPSPQWWRQAMLLRRRLPIWCADAVIFNSRRIADTYVREYGYSRDRIHVVRNGEWADPSDVHTAPARPLRIASVGRVTKAKGADTLLEAFSTIARRHPGARLTYFGDGPLVPELRDRASGMGLSDAVRFAGYESDRERIYREMDICVQPSRRESMSNSVIEAMARGIPCVVTDVGGMPETVVDGECGFVVPPEAPAACAEAISRLMADEDTFARISTAAARRARRLFDPHEFQRATVAAILG